MNGENKMNRVNYHVNKQIDEQDILEVIQESPLAIEIIQELNLTKNEILNDYDKILFYASQNECCRLCKGLKYCNKSKKGYVLTLTRNEDNQIVETMGLCKYYKDFDRKYKNIWYSSYPIETLIEQFKLDEYRSLALGDLTPKTFKTMYNALYHKILTKGCYIQLKEGKQRKQFVYGLTTTLSNEYTCCVTRISSLLTELKSLFNDKESFEELLNKFYNAQIVILDDVGGESVTAWSRDEILLPLLNHRLDQNLTTIFISEFAIEQLPLLYTLQNDELKAKKFISKIKESILE